MRSYTIKKIASMPDEYVYQHPKHPHKKSMSLETQWVKDFLSNGGLEITLIEKANQTRPVVLRRAIPEPKKRKTKGC